MKISAAAIPLPTSLPQDFAQELHAHTQRHGHFPRPRSAFILFQCDFVRRKKVPEEVENDRRNISRIIGTVWREMSLKENQSWIKMTEREKREHGKVYPGYRHSPGEAGIGTAGDGGMLTGVPGRKNRKGEMAICGASSCPPIPPIHIPTRGRAPSRPFVSNVPSLTPFNDFSTPLPTIIPPIVPSILISSLSAAPPPVLPVPIASLRSPRLCSPMRLPCSSPGMTSRGDRIGS